jgi:3-carboxy-cis,cis-muconate cycloisomerase
MRAQLESSHGLIMAESLTLALARGTGRPEAVALVREAIRRARETGLDLYEASRLDPRIRSLLSDDALVQALDPAGYLGSSDLYIDQALAEFAGLKADAAPAGGGEVSR